ncbi:MAG: DNA primase [Phascolarctobacterium sp.]|nr:DNA primase [Phascolarctobacterium sp.]
MSVEVNDFKEQVRSHANIVEVVSGYVALKKKGRKHWGCCPFHGEKTPSFTVDEEKGFFYCFGCHEAGDVFKFIMKSENCSFIDAVKFLANKYGIPVPERQKSAVEIAREQKAKQVIATNDLAARFYQACLTKTPYGKAALEYLHNRGITDAIIESFSIGFAVNSFNGLMNALGKRGCSVELLLQAGLAVPGKHGGAYDKFRGRVMIPIKDPRGKIVGFTGRVLGDGVPKYMNTGETEFFIKRYLLFGLDIAVKEIRNTRQAIVVEGHMDAISLHAAGIANAVASMGTAFATEQARLLKRMADEVVFCYDSDNAGRNAAVRAVSIARSVGLKVRVANVPDGKDPDEFIRQHGKEAFLEVIRQGLDGIDYQVEETILQNNVTNLAGKVEAVSKIIPFLLECKNEIEAAEHIRRLAQRLTIDEGLIAAEYRKSSKNSGVQASGLVQQPAAQSTNTAEQQAEEMLLAVLMEHPTLALGCQDIIDEVGFVHRARRQVFDSILAYDGEQAVEVHPLMEVLGEEASSVLAGILSKNVPEGDCEKIVDDCLRQMKKSFLEKEYEKHRLLADEFERLGNERFMEELMESQRIKNEIKRLYGS